MMSASSRASIVTFRRCRPRQLAAPACVPICAPTIGPAGAGTRRAAVHKVSGPRQLRQQVDDQQLAARKHDFER